MAATAATTAPGPAPPSGTRRARQARRGPVPWKLLRPRSSILLKVVAALVAAVVVSGTATEVVTARLTSSVMARQARELTKGHLSILTEAYQARERHLVVSLRNLSEVLTVTGLPHPDRRPELIGELGRTAGNLELDVLRVVDGRGGELEPPAGTGAALAAPSFVPTASVADPRSRIVPTAGGRYAQVLAVPLQAEGGAYLLVGGHEFGDPFAYQLRQQVGSDADVTLVAGGRVVGTTLADPPARPPGLRGGRLPVVPEILHVDGVKNVVAYAPVSRGPDGEPEGALGVALPDLLLAIDRTLVQTRLVAVAILTLVALSLGWLLFRGLVNPMVGLARTAGRIATGDVDASFRVRRPDEIGVLADSLERMRLELRSKLGLIARQAADLRASSQRIVAAEDEERHRLARDLHDGIQQQLVVLRIQLGMLEDQGASGSGAEAGQVQQVGEQLDRAIEQLREVTQDLYPSILLDRGLAAALRSHVGRLPVSARLRCDPEELPRLAPEIESAAYFLVCEATTNSLKHAGASTIELSLVVEGEWLTVLVTDDGQGFEVGGRRKGGGLQHMQDRATAFGGALDIDAAPGRGTAARATFPARRPVEPSRRRGGVGLGA